MSTEEKLNIALKIGFGLVLLLLVSSMLIGLMQMSATNNRLEKIVYQDMVKRELALSSSLALYARLNKFHEMIMMSDVFEQEAESHNIRKLGLVYLDIRRKLEELAESDKERELLGNIREQVVKARPYTEKVITEIIAGDKDKAVTILRDKAIPNQNEVIDRINEYISFQKSEIDNAVKEAIDSYHETRLLLLLLGSATFFIGIVISIVAIRSVSIQAKLLQHQAMYDGLTNLPNRALFADRFNQAILYGRREKQSFALLTMDLNRFKEINDTLGHEAGDTVLQAAAVQVRGCLRESDTVARMGGDEFAVLLATATDLNGSITVARKILAAVKQPVDYKGQKLEIDASLGIVMFPEHGDNPDELLRAADVAMYHAKEGQSGYRIYDEELNDGMVSHLVMQNEIRDAINNNELVLHYQPRIDFRNNTINGVEALVRWQHPKHGLLAPDKFIPQAEQSGLIKPLTYYVLRESLMQCAEWKARGMTLPVSVNISAINIQDPEFPGQVARLLEEIDVPASQLELELTETAVMAEPVRAVECIKKLHDLGLQVAVDDFGTGYSSMAYLKELLVARIKIDRSFVTDMIDNHNDAVIVRSTVELGHNLGMKVIAEGVEDQNVWDRLKEMGCDGAQGFYMGRPLDPVEFLAWMNDSPWSSDK